MREAVDRELRRSRPSTAAPSAAGSCSSSGLNQALACAGLGEQNLHLLAPRVDLVVALILVVLQRGEIPDLVRELADVVGQLHRREQSLGALRQRALQRGVGADFRFELVVGGLPLRPVREDVREVPLEPIGNVGAVAQFRCRGCFDGSEGIHWDRIAQVRPVC